MKPQLRPEAMRIAVEVDSLLRAELIKTKHEQIARLTDERDEWEKACEANTAMGASVAEMWKDKAERYKDTALAEAEAMEDQKSRALAAKAQVQALREALERSVGALNMLTEPEAIKVTNVSGAWAECVAALSIARAALRSEK